MGIIYHNILSCVGQVGGHNPRLALPGPLRYALHNRRVSCEVKLSQRDHSRPLRRGVSGAPRCRWAQEPPVRGREPAIFGRNPPLHRFSHPGPARSVWHLSQLTRGAWISIELSRDPCDAVATG